MSLQYERLQGAIRKQQGEEVADAFRVPAAQRGMSLNPVLDSWSRDAHDFTLMVELQLDDTQCCGKDVHKNDLSLTPLSWILNSTFCLFFLVCALETMRPIHPLTVA